MSAERQGARSEGAEQASRGALKEFLHDEAAGGVALLIAAAVALIWANSGAAASYVEFWHHLLTLGRGSWAVSEDLQHWVNDGLMVLFFFVVGLEIKRELVVGELRRPRAAALPALAAVGGVALPAVLYVVIAPGGAAARGWGVPMATDIAFAVGILALFGRSASAGAKLLLLSIAIVDDLIAILVIAIFYSDSVSWAWLAVAAVGLLVVVAMRAFMTNPVAYLVPAFVVWLGMLESGIHPTLAGVLLGLLTPAAPVGGRHVLELLEHRLHPISAFLVVPVFALANAGINLRGGALEGAAGHRVTWAVVVGLVVGKTLGVAGTVFGLLRLGVGVLPTGMRTREVLPVAALSGIGFTVALFISDLAFSDPALVRPAKVGIFAGSIVAGIVGAVLLRVTSQTDSRDRTADPG
jgi:NhaA family Na+:H+ antiporter